MEFGYIERYYDRMTGQVKLNDWLQGYGVKIVSDRDRKRGENYQKMYFPAETSWEYSGKTHDYFNGTTSIAPVVEENELKLHIYGDVLEVQGTESGISIYAITGGKMAESKSNRIDISRLPAGIYLLNTARGSIKFIHK